MKEHWNLYQNREYQALPWTGDWNALSVADVADLPNTCGDFLRYAPNDGFGTLVPTDLPRELPRCETRFAVYHSPEHLYVFIQAMAPEPVSGLEELTQEGLSVIFQLPGLDCGIYGGLNEKGEHIARAIMWDALAQPKNAYDAWQWSAYLENQWKPLDGYDAKVWHHDDGTLTGAWRFEREPFNIGEEIGFSIGRQCFRTNELVSWGSALVWEPRSADFGVVRLVDEAPVPVRPSVSRIDLSYDLTDETGVFKTSWQHPWPELDDPDELGNPNAGAYADFIPLQTIVLNGVQHTETMADTNTAELPIVDGWNRLEVMTAVGSPLAVAFQKVSGHTIHVPARVTGDFPSMDELRDAFVSWHEQNEQSYNGGGIWGKSNGRPCLDHNGVFHAEPYIYGLQVFGENDVWQQRVIESAERSLAEQRDDGTYPGYCGGGASAQDNPPPFSNGAFSHGSVGQMMVLAHELTGNETYLKSAISAAEAYPLYKIEVNQNYCAFALWHLAMLIRVTGNERWLDQAAWYAEHCVARAIDLAGCQDGHNYYCGYGGITLKGLALVLGVMPDNHALKPRLRHWTLRFANQMLDRQQANGRFHERNRKYLGYESIAPGGGLFFTDAAIEGDDLRPSLAAATRAAIEDKDGLTLALAGRYLNGEG